MKKIKVIGIVLGMGCMFAGCTDVQKELSEAYTLQETYKEYGTQEGYAVNQQKAALLQDLTALQHDMQAQGGFQCEDNSWADLPTFLATELLNYKRYDGYTKRDRWRVRTNAKEVAAGMETLGFTGLTAWCEQMDVILENMNGITLPYSLAHGVEVTYYQGAAGEDSRQLTVSLETPVLFTRKGMEEPVNRYATNGWKYVWDYVAVQGNGAQTMLELENTGYEDYMGIFYQYGTVYSALQNDGTAMVNMDAGRELVHSQEALRKLAELGGLSRYPKKMYITFEKEKPVKMLIEEKPVWEEYGSYSSAADFFGDWLDLEQTLFTEKEKEVVSLLMKDMGYEETEVQELIGGWEKEKTFPIVLENKNNCVDN